MCLAASVIALNEDIFLFVLNFITVAYFYSWVFVDAKTIFFYALV